MTEKEEKAIKYVTYMQKKIDFNKIGYVYGNEDLDIVLKALEQKDKEIAELRIKQISSNLNNSIKQKQKENEQLQALNEGWKIELEQKDKEIQELKEKWNKDTHTLQNQLDLANADRVEKDKIIDLMAKKINEAFFESGDFEEWFENKICKVLKSEDYTYLEKDIKQYFKEKVSEENV